MLRNRIAAAIAVLVVALSAATVVPGQSAAAGRVAGPADEPWQGTLTVVNRDGNDAPAGSFGGTFTLNGLAAAPSDGIYPASLSYSVDYTVEQFCPDCLPEPCTLTFHYTGGDTIPGAVILNYGTLDPAGPPALISFQPSGSTSIPQSVHLTGCGHDESGPAGGLAFTETRTAPDTATGTAITGSLPDFAAPDLFTVQADLHKDAAAVPTCFGRTATIVGTDASETIAGTDGPDVIVGGGGNDTINAGDGDDWVCDASGVGNLNTLRGGPGNDHVQGAPTLVGNGGNDVLIVGGTAGSAVLVNGGPGNDTLRAPVLKAVFVPGPGRDRVVGNAVPNDAVSYARSRQGVTVDLAKGTSTGQGTDALSKVEGVIGSPARDVVRGNSRSNELFGLGGGDVLQGRGGQDFLHGGAGADRLNGGAGQDFCDGTTIDRRVSCEHRF